MREDVESFSQALRELVARPQLRQRFMEIETSERVREELGISNNTAYRPEGNFGQATERYRPRVVRRLRQ